MSTTAPDVSTQPSTLRLTLRTRRRVGGVAGGWWPHSRDLATEVPDLVRAVRASGWPVFRATYAMTFWDAAPRALHVDGELIKLGGFRTQDPSVVTLVDASGWGRLELLVVPPETDPDFAASALATAGRDGDEMTAAHMLHDPASAAAAPAVGTSTGGM